MDCNNRFSLILLACFNFFYKNLVFVEINLSLCIVYNEFMLIIKLFISLIAFPR